MDGKLRNMTTIYLFKGDKVLLLYRQGGRVVNNVWTGSAGGHFEAHELNDAKACVVRELREELGLTEKDITNLKLRYVTLRNTKGEIRVNYYFFADLVETVLEDLSSNEGLCKWFSLEDIHTLEMPYTAKFVMGHYCEVGRHTDIVYAGVANSECVVFNDLNEF